MQKYFYMMVGIPGSGKSTYIKNELNSNNFSIVSSDDYIQKKADVEGITYNEAFPKYVKEASKNLDVSLYDAVAASKDIIWDQTNLFSSKRIEKLKKLPSYYKKIAVVFPIPEDLEKRLNSRPGKNIPDKILKSMINNFEDPTLSEGFDEIRKVS